MWPLGATLPLGLWCFGSAQLLFKNIKFIDYSFCNETVTIPCYVTNMESTDSRELFVRWIFKGENIFIFDGPEQKSVIGNGFSSSKISIPELLKGDASLCMNKDDAKLGNYTCEVTELSREGTTTVELKYTFVTWFASNEYILIIVFPIVAVSLFLTQVCFITALWSLKELVE